ncbi:MAG: hypothetical protein HY692_04745 [Cyanobacteria bacterium NC_groundwater_1444_Ag_S-0.65um_54_12]|nr:hypothetical protein [Cyanobacteria bacterium NC_groundwater_1444_Ag_S-0.65um_54_12]
MRDVPRPPTPVSTISPLPVTTPIVIPVASPVASPIASPVSLPDTGIFLPDQASRVLTLVNQERTKASLRALAGAPQLDQLARARSKDMGDRQYLSHYTPEGTNIFDMFRKAGIAFRTAGENIAKNNALSSDTARVAFAGWMNSPGHKANILNTAYGQLGVGVYRTTAGICYLVQVFTD